MKRLDDTLATMLFLAFCLGVAFLFVGTPTLWSELHAAALRWVSAGCTP